MTDHETHAKNLAWIDGKDREAGDLLDHALTTHREVLELHGPTGNEIYSFCGECEKNSAGEYDTSFPCLTCSTITKGLGIE